MTSHARDGYRSLHATLRLCACVAIACTTGCSDKAKKQDPERAAQVVRCVQGLESAMSHIDGTAVDVMVSSCRQVCPGLQPGASVPSARIERASAVMARCGGFCTAAAERAWRDAPPERAYAALLESCGAAAFGLDESRSFMMSDSWLFLVRTFEWLQNNQRHADQATRDTLARAGEYTHFSMPVPAHVDGLYTLAKARAVRPVRAHFYAIVSADPQDSVRVAALPIVRLRKSLLEQRPVPGGYFPGQALAPGDQAYADLYRTFAELHPPEMRAKLERRPLVLADAHVPASRLVNAMRSIGVDEFSLGVSGPRAVAHPITVEHLSGESAAPVLRMGADATDEIILMGTQEVRIPRADRARIEAKLTDLSVEFAPLDKVEIVLPPDADTAALVAALDLVATSKFATALVR